MLKYVNTQVTFSEVPDQITLCVNISNCPYHCKGCHSKYLWDDIGQELNEQVVSELIDKNSGITCFCFMGDGGHEEEVIKLAKFIRENYPSLLIAFYTGAETLTYKTHSVFDYIKLGSYVEELGPITSKTTNQRMYVLGKHLHKMDASDNMYYDITDRFWKDDSDMQE